MMDLPQIDPGEAALAVIGINAVIAQTVPRVGIERLREMTGLAKRIEQQAKDLVAGELIGGPISRPHSYRALLERLSRGLEPVEVGDLIKKFPPDASDVSGPFVLAVQQAMDHLKGIFPTSEYVTFTGPQELEPPADQVGAFFVRLLVINDPLLVFDLAGSGALLQSQSAAVKEFFPSLAQAITAAIYQAVVSAKAEKKSYQLPQRVAVGVANWLGNRTVDFQPAPVERQTPGVKRPNPAALQAIAKLGQPQSSQLGG